MSTPANSIQSLDAAIQQAAEGMKLDSAPASGSNNETGGITSSEAIAPESPAVEETVKEAPQALDPIVEFLRSKGIDREAFDNAVNLYQAVNDENRAGAVIKYLADNYNAHINAKGKVQAAGNQSVTQIIKESLGEGFEEFADKIGPAVERAIENKMRPVTQTLQQHQLSTQTQSNLEIAQSFAQEYLGEANIPDNIADEMTRLVSVLPPSGKMPVNEYIYTIGKLAMQNLNIAPKSPKPASSPRPTAPPSPISRLAKSAAKPNEGVAVATKNITLDEALKLADASIQGGKS